MKYFAYCRKSSEEESKQIQSLETQESLLKEYASKYNLQIIEVIRESKSAKTDGNRPLFSSMLERIRRKEADGLLVAHVDRLSRNGIECGQLTKLVETGFLKEIRTPGRVYSSYMDLMYIGFEFIFAEHYSRNLSVRVKEGVQTKLNKGEYPSYAPVGYINKFPSIVPDPIRAPYITELFNLYKTGNHSERQLSQMMFDKGLRSRTNKRIGKSAINRILRNPEYFGVIRRNGKLYNATYPPLIDKATFDLCRDISDGKGTGRKLTHNFVYRGYLFCHVCGCKLTATIKKSRHVYYYCTNGKGQCSEHQKYFTQLRVEELLQGQLDSFSLDEEFANLTFEAYADGLRNASAVNGDAPRVLKEQIKSITVKLNNLLEALLANRIDTDIYDSKKLELSNEKVKLETQLKNLKTIDIEFTLEQVQKVKNKAAKCAYLFKKGISEEKADLLNGLLWNATTENQEMASIQYNQPYSFLQNLNKNRDFETWRRGRGSNPR